MPLHLKCTQCGRVLVLEDAFAGAHCRCRHCRTMLQVPGSSSGVISLDAQRSAASRASRPARPPLADEVAPVAARISAPSVRHATTSPARRWNAPMRLTAAVAVLVFAVAAPTFYVAFYREAPTSVHAPVAMQPAPKLPDHLSEEAIAALTADPMTHYFGIRLTGNTVAYVVDGHESMAPYIENLAFLTNSVNAAIPAGTRRVGIVQALAEEGKFLNEVMEPTGDLMPTLNTKLTAGRTDLSAALSMASGWYTDQLFLVLARKLSQEELRVLVRSAEQTGAVVNVIALGEAAGQSDLSAISSATRGQFISADDPFFAAVVNRQYDAVNNSPGRKTSL